MLEKNRIVGVINVSLCNARLFCRGSHKIGYGECVYMLQTKVGIMDIKIGVVHIRTQRKMDCKYCIEKVG